MTIWQLEGTIGPEVTKMRLCDVPRSFGTNTGPSIGQKTDQILDHRHIAKTRIWLCSAVSFGPVGRQGDTPRHIVTRPVHYRGAGGGICAFLDENIDHYENFGVWGGWI